MGVAACLGLAAGLGFVLGFAWYPGCSTPPLVLFPASSWAPPKIFKEGMKKNSELLQVRENVVESILLETELVEIRNQILFASLNL